MMNSCPGGQLAVRQFAVAPHKGETLMFKPPPFVLALAAFLAHTAGHASNCEEIQAGIADRIRAGGITRFTLSTVDAEASAPGRVVGRCGQGSKKIMLVQEPGVQGEPGAKAPATARRREVITECRDGTVVADGECSR
jgi:hypothetical protein